jgi:SAM-dependent methyltransferase
VAFDGSPDAIAAAAENTKDLQRIHLVEGSVEAPPFREGVFDLAYCFGVLHHIAEPAPAFRALGRTVRSGGRFSIWVYGPRQGVALHLANSVRGLTSGLRPDQLHNLSRVIASGLRAFSHTPYRLLGRLPVAKAVVSRLPVHDHHKWPYAVVVADVYDRLQIPITRWFHRELIDKLYTDDGYLDVQVSRRVANNESFRGTGIRR